MQSRGISNLVLGFALAVGLVATGCGSNATSQPLGGALVVPATGNGIQNFTQREFVFVGNQNANNGLNQINEFQLNQNNANLLALSTINNGANIANVVVVSPQNLNSNGSRFVAAVTQAINNGAGGGIQLYTMNDSGGMAATGAFVPLAGATNAACWDPTGQVLFVGSFNAGVGQINSFNIQANQLTNLNVNLNVSGANQAQPVALSTVIGPDGSLVLCAATQETVVNVGATDVTSILETITLVGNVKTLNLAKVTADANVTNAAIGTLAVAGSPTTFVGTNLNGQSANVNQFGVITPSAGNNNTILTANPNANTNLAAAEAGGVPMFYLGTNAGIDNVGAFTVGNLATIVLLPTAAGNNISGGIGANGATTDLANNVNTVTVLGNVTAGGTITSAAVVNAASGGAVNNFLFLGINAATGNLNAFELNPNNGGFVLEIPGGVDKDGRTLIQNPVDGLGFPVTAGGGTTAVLGLSSNFNPFNSGSGSAQSQANVILVATGANGQLGSLSAALVNGNGSLNGQLNNPPVGTSVATGQVPNIIGGNSSSFVSTFGP